MAGKSTMAILEKYSAERENLLPILHEFNDKKGYIGKNVMQDIADYLSISANEVYGTASFYAFFNLRKKGKYVIRLCRSISCSLAGAAKIAKALEKELKISFGETTKDNKFSLEYTNCMGMCDEGPSMLVNKDVYTKLTPQKVKTIIAQLKKGGKK